MSRAAGTVISTLPTSVLARVSPGEFLFVNGSSDVVWVDPRRWLDIPVIVGKRAPPIRRHAARHTAKFAAIFAAGFATALLYSPEPADDYVLRLVLPPPAGLNPPVPPKPLPAVSVSAFSPAHPHGPAADPAVAVPNTPEPAPIHRPATSAAPSYVTPPAIVDLVAVRAASTLAIKTEIAQPWKLSGLYGYAVAGPIKFAGAGTCRVVAVWIEAKGVAGRSTSTSYCLAANGKWERSAMPPSPGTETVEPDGEGAL